jgi:putative protease
MLRDDNNRTNIGSEVKTMELILNINQYGYSVFLDSKVDSFVVGLKGFCSGYEMSYELDEIPRIEKYVHEKEKKLYISLNSIMNEYTASELEKYMHDIKDLDVDGFVLSDFGALEIFMEHGLTDKVIFNPITTITNKYNANILNNYGINHVCIANELNIKDILEIASYTKGKIEILGQGYYQICNSKRPLLTHFLKKFKKKSASETNHYYIQEESRDYAYPIVEINDELFIYIDKQRSVMPYLKELLNANVSYLRIDTIFMEIEEINAIIEAYKDSIDDITNLESSLSKLKENTDSNYKCLDNISILKKEKENE